MIYYKSGNIFNSDAQVITNPVNCVGVMGRGLALAFKERYPAMFEDYQARCKKGLVTVNNPYLWTNGKVKILNFATKKHWKDDSDLRDIEMGLRSLALNYKKMGIKSIAMPPVGCGLGGLNWRDVEPLFKKILDPLPDLDVFLYVNDI